MSAYSKDSIKEEGKPLSGRIYATHLTNKGLSLEYKITPINQYKKYGWPHSKMVKTVQELSKIGYTNG